MSAGHGGGNCGHGGLSSGGCDVIMCEDVLVIFEKRFETGKNLNSGK